MAKTRAEKEQIIEELIDKLNSAKSVVFADFHGLKVDQSEDIRRKCYEEGVEFKASKKTLLGIALEKAGFEDVNPKEFEGGVATVFCEDDQVAPAKITSEFADEYGVNIFGGILEQEFIPDDKVKDLAELPSKKQLKAQLVSALSSPMTGLVSSLSATSSDLVNVLDSIKEKKQD
ncbi:MAG: 50S ribosomal protein L10 [Parcubacteria group bacterium QH_9_35_7]|nr:MAG: 50S ribosomal protein L10 [Parcubacteria group bacterium QH_9_35_7]